MQAIHAIPFETPNRNEAASIVIENAVATSAVSIHLVNAYSLVLAAKDARYRETLSSDSAVNFPDGVPVAWLLRALGSRGAAVVRGPSLFADVLQQSQGMPIRHLLLGSTTPTLRELQQNIEARFPNAELVGCFAPAFGPVDDSMLGRCVDEIAATAPDVVWVALGTPKQDLAAAELAARTGVTCVAVGAAFDFLAGTTREAPSGLQGTGFEWVYRLLRDPRRLWRRYVFGNPQFVILALRELWLASRRTRRQKTDWR